MRARTRLSPQPRGPEARAPGPECYTLAQVLLLQGREAEATALFERAWTTNGRGSEALSWQAGWVVPTSLARLATRDPDNLARAFRFYDEAIGVIEQVRRRLGQRTDKLGLSLRTTHVYLEAAALAAQNGRTARAYRYLLGAKARETLEELERGG